MCGPSDVKSSRQAAAEKPRSAKLRCCWRHHIHASGSQCSPMHVGGTWLLIIKGIMWHTLTNTRQVKASGFTMQIGKVAKKSRKARKAKTAAVKTGAAADPQMLAKRSLRYQKAIARHEAQVQELMRKVSQRCKHSACR